MRCLKFLRLLALSLSLRNVSAADDDWHLSGLSSDEAISSLSNAGTCCGALSLILGDQVTYPGQAAYNSSLTSYYSVQEAQLRPSCIVTPNSKEDVSLAVFLLNIGNTVFPGKCNFAIRSGGHTPLAGAANIASGVTIDLKNLNHVRVSADNSTVDIGPGNRWGDVYSVLDAQGLSTSGGRVASVGVGGLVTGGGISFFSAQYGYVCDNVENFEVVLASGQVVNANADTNPSLWRALRGGSNNFGIVTSFTIRAFPQGDFWGGFMGIDVSTIEQQFQAFESLTGSPQYDPYAALIFDLIWDSNSNAWSTIYSLEYTRAVENPPFFQNFTSLPQTFSTMRISNLTDFTVEISSSVPAGRRDLFVTSTYKNSAEMMAAIYEISQGLVQPLLSIPSLGWTISFQPQPSVINGKAATRGGNSLGLDEGDGDLFNVLLNVIWEDEADDSLLHTQAMELFEQADAKARELGVYHPYIYLNYAAGWQDPISGYGADSKRHLQETSKLYDPTGVFQTNVPGGFKLFV